MSKTDRAANIPAPLCEPRVWVPAAIGVVFALALVYSSRLFAPSDDTFIYLVYVKNALAGNGLTFNGDHVQGFTSVLWTVMIWLVGGAGVALPQAANMLSGGSGLLVLMSAYFLGRQLGLSRGRALIAPVLLAAAGDFAFYMSNGLETVFFTAILTLAVGLAVGERHRSIMLPLALALAVLTRPEGALVAVLIAGLLFLRTRELRPVLVLGVVMVIIILPVVIALKSYYGQWLPNTFYAKSGARLANLPQGLQYLANFMSWAFLFCLPVLLFAMSRWRSLDAPVRGLVVLLAVWLAYVAVQGGDNMVGFRALVPILPVMYVLVVRATHTLAARLTVTAVVLCALYQIVIYNFGNLHGSSWNVEVRNHAYNWAVYYEHRRKIADYLLERLPKDAVIAVNAAGTVPYFTGLQTIDMLGLNNEHIARAGKRDRTMPYGHQTYLGEWVVSQRPDAIFFGGAGSVKADRFVGDLEIANLDEFKRLYRAQSLPGGFHGYFYDGRGVQDPLRDAKKRRAASRNGKTKN